MSDVDDLIAMCERQVMQSADGALWAEVAHALRHGALENVRLRALVRIAYSIPVTTTSIDGGPALCCQRCERFRALLRLAANYVEDDSLKVGIDAALEGR